MKIPSAWSSDARFLLYHTPVLGKGGADLYVLPMEGPDRNSRQACPPAGHEVQPKPTAAFSRTSWIAYASDDPLMEVYAAVPRADLPGHRWARRSGRCRRRGSGRCGHQ